MIDTLVDDPVAEAGLLRQRVRALAGGQAEAFEMLFYNLGTNHRLALIAQGAGKRLSFFAMLLADLAWGLGDRNAHHGAPPPPAPEVEEIRRVYRPRGTVKRQYLMTEEERSVVVDYLEALLAVTARCIDLDPHAPSPTLAREARRFIEDVTALRDADLETRPG